jgi:hypothetical protein
MKTWSLAALALMLAVAQTSRADVPAPPPKDPSYPLVIDAQPKAAEARLIIPQKMLGKMRSDAGQGNENEASAFAPSRLQTIVAGAALAMAIAFGGLWLVRRGPGGTRSLALLVGAVAFLGIGATLWADGVIRPAPVNRTDRVIIEITDKGDDIKLIVNKAKLAKLVEEKK